MSKIFKQIPALKLPARLPNLKRHIQSGSLRILVTHYGAPLAFLLPLQDIEELTSEEFSIETSAEVSLNSFCNRLQAKPVDCIYLTFHSRRIIAAVSPRFAPVLALPLIGSAVI